MNLFRPDLQLLIALRYDATTMSGEFKLGRLFAESVRLYFSRFPNFMMILLLPAFATAALLIGVAVSLLGFAAEGKDVDPATLTVYATPLQWVTMWGAGLVTAIVLAASMAASVHLASAPERISPARAFGRNTAKSMQIFWLQILIYFVALRYSPLAVLVLWFSVGFGSVVALREDLGPSEGMDRAWVLTEGYRGRVMALELLTVVPFFAVAFAVSYLFLTPGSWFNLNSISPYVRVAISPLMTGALLAPLQFMFVAFACGYEMLKRAEQPALHAKAASSVSSS